MEQYHWHHKFLHELLHRWLPSKIILCYLFLDLETHEIAYGDIMWVHNINYEMSWLLLLSLTLLLTSTTVDHTTNCPIPILPQRLCCIYWIICFIWLLPFTTLLCVYLANRFLQYLLQPYFSIYLALCFVTCYNHVMHMYYVLGVSVTWVPVMFDVTASYLPPNIWILPLLSWIYCGVIFML